MKEFTEELMFTGQIVQDSDKSVDWPEREDRFNRYIELLESIKGNEGLDVARTIIKSMQAEQDYGAYQTTQRILGRFPDAIYTKALVIETPFLIKNKSDWAGELLCGLANSVGTENEDSIDLFNNYLKVADPESKTIIVEYIKEEEKDGWLEHRVGVLGWNNA
jgi:hypothetical protein